MIEDILQKNDAGQNFGPALKYLLIILAARMILSDRHRTLLLQECYVATIHHCIRPKHNRFTSVAKEIIHHPI